MAPVEEPPPGGKQDEEGDYESRRVDSTDVAPNAEGPFGVRLCDDMLNVFCDRAQLAAPRRVNGFFAIQSVLCDPGTLRTQIRPEEEVIQIIFDQEREHYITVHLYYVEETPFLRIYDPLLHANYMRDRDIKDVVNSSVICQVLDIFGHLKFKFDEETGVPVEYKHDIDPQTDGWSCGYRAIGVVMDLLLQRDPAESKYDIRSLYDLYIWANRDGLHTWDDFLSFSYRSYRQPKNIHCGNILFTEELYEEKLDEAKASQEVPELHRTGHSAESTVQPSEDNFLASTSKSNGSTKGVRETRRNYGDRHVQSNADSSIDGRADDTHSRANAGSSATNSSAFCSFFGKSPCSEPNLITRSSPSDLLHSYEQFPRSSGWIERRQQMERDKREELRGGVGEGGARIGRGVDDHQLVSWGSESINQPSPTTHRSSGTLHSGPIECNVPLSSFTSHPSTTIESDLFDGSCFCAETKGSFHTESNVSIANAYPPNEPHQAVIFRPRFGYGDDEQAGFDADVSSLESSVNSTRFDVCWERKPSPPPTTERPRHSIRSNGLNVVTEGCVVRPSNNSNHILRSSLSLSTSSSLVAGFFGYV